MWPNNYESENHSNSEDDEEFIEKGMRQALADDALWKRTQQNTFTRWANQYLQALNLHIDDIQIDLSNGVILRALVEFLTGKKIPGGNRKPNFRSQKLENVSMVLDFLENTEGIRLVNIDAPNIVDGNLKLILGLMWTLILYYSISLPAWEFQQPDASSETREKTPKQKLMRWIREKLPAELSITNFTSDWHDGRAITALVNACVPDVSLNWKICNFDNALQCIREAMRIAEQRLNIALLIKPREMIDPKLDEQSMMTYLSQYPNAKLNPISPIKAPIVPIYSTDEKRNPPSKSSIPQVSTVQRRQARFLDAGEEPNKPLEPITFEHHGKVKSLRDAVRSIEHLVDNLQHYVTFSLEQCQDPQEGLTQDESASLFLYSLQWPENKTSFYTIFNRALRNENRMEATPFYPYLTLFMSALDKLPSIRDRVWRAVNGDLSAKYRQGTTHVWWGASSCSDMVHVTDTFLDPNQPRTLFNIKCYKGKSIKNHSRFPNEVETILPPGTHLHVKSQSNPAVNFYIVDMEQIRPPPSEDRLAHANPSNSDSKLLFIWLDPSAFTSSDHLYMQKKLRAALHTPLEMCDDADQCEKWFKEKKYSRIVLIVSGRLGEQYVPKWHDFSKITAIIVSCMDVEKNKTWAKHYPKVKAVVSDLNNVIINVKIEETAAE